MSLKIIKGKFVPILKLVKAAEGVFRPCLDFDRKNLIFQSILKSCPIDYQRKKHLPLCIFLGKLDNPVQKKIYFSEAQTVYSKQSIQP